MPGKNESTTLVRNADKTTGNEQYPSKQIHCIKDNVPPSKVEFIVIIILPIHIIIKIVVNTKPDVFLEVKQRILYYK